MKDYYESGQASSAMTESQTVPPSSSSLIEKIVKFRWKQVDETLPAEVLARKDEILPSLIELVKERKYWNTSDENEGWAPFTAAHLLSLTKEKQALEALIYVLYNYSEELGDWLTEDMPSLLSYFGSDAFDTLVNAVLDRTLDQWSRNAAARAMMVIANKSEDAGLRKRTIECLKEAINKEKNLETRSWLVSEFSEMKDKDSLPFIKSLFDAGMVDTMVTTYEELEDVYAGKYDHMSHMRDDTKDPLDYFKTKDNPIVEPSITEEQDYPYTFQPSTMQDEEYIQPPFPSQIPKTKKIGRNDPCPCGSGKKYKKCCLKKEQARIST